MKGLKEYKTLLRLIGQDKKKLIFASVLIFLSGVAEIFTGYLNGAAVEAITKLQIKKVITQIIAVVIAYNPWQIK